MSILSLFRWEVKSRTLVMMSLIALSSDWYCDKWGEVRRGGDMGEIKRGVVVDGVRSGYGTAISGRGNEEECYVVEVIRNGVLDI